MVDGRCCRSHNQPTKVARVLPSPVGASRLRIAAALPCSIQASWNGNGAKPAAALKWLAADKWAGNLRALVYRKAGAQVGVEGQVSGLGAGFYAISA